MKTANLAVDFLRLEPAARFERGEGLLGDLSLKCGPAAGGSSCMDIVKLLREVPYVGPRYDERRRSDLKPYFLQPCQQVLGQALTNLRRKSEHWWTPPLVGWGVDQFQ